MRQDRQRQPAAPRGQTPRVDRMRWLLAFVRADVPAANDDALRELRDGAAAFVDHPWTGRHWRDREAEILLGPRGRGHQHERWRTLTAQYLADLQAEVTRGWAILSRPPAIGKSTDLDTGETTEARAWPAWTANLWNVTSSVGRGADGVLLRGLGGSWRSSFLAFAGDLTVEYWDRLRLCARPGCGVTFLPARGKQRACSVGCQRSLYREAKPRDYHEEWVARQLKQTGAPRLKIRRRRR